MRFVEAIDTDAAESEAINLLRFEPRLQKGLLNEEGDPPVLSVEEIETIPADLVPEITPGLTFFTDEDDTQL